MVIKDGTWMKSEGLGKLQWKTKRYKHANIGIRDE